MALGAAMRTFSEPLLPAGAPATDRSAGYATLVERGKAAEKDFKGVAESFLIPSPAGLPATWQEWQQCRPATKQSRSNN